MMRGPYKRRQLSHEGAWVEHGHPCICSAAAVAGALGVLAACSADLPSAKPIIQSSTTATGTGGGTIVGPDAGDGGSCGGAGVPCEVISVAAGWDISCAVFEDGAAACWGDSMFGSLGNGTTSGSPVPGEVQGLEDTAQLAAGRNFSCARRTSGTMACWGTNQEGSLGLGTFDSGLHLFPVDLLGLSDIQDIATGAVHACALDGSGIVHCWGGNTWGAVGDGSFVDRSTPAAVPMEKAVDVEAGDNHTCALIAAGPMVCWGQHFHGKLGIAEEQHQPLPVVVPVEGVVQMTLGMHHTCVLTDDGDVLCWGENGFGQLGRPAEHGAHPTPLPVEGLGNVVQIDAGGNHTCALTVDRGVKCWGSNVWGQLGDGTTANRHVPEAVIGLPGVKLLAIGGIHSCALTSDGAVWCWGNNGAGALGNGRSGNDERINSSPVQVRRGSQRP